VGVHVRGGLEGYVGRRGRLGGGDGLAVAAAVVVGVVGKGVAGGRGPDVCPYAALFRSCQAQAADAGDGHRAGGLGTAGVDDAGRAGHDGRRAGLADGVGDGARVVVVVLAAAEGPRVGRVGAGLGVGRPAEVEVGAEVGA